MDWLKKWKNFLNDENFSGFLAECLWAAGADAALDILGPTDMMDGRGLGFYSGELLDRNGYTDTSIYVLPRR